MQIRILRHEKDTMAKMQAFVQQRRESPIEFLKIQIADLICIANMSGSGFVMQDFKDAKICNA